MDRPAYPSGTASFLLPSLGAVKPGYLFGTVLSSPLWTPAARAPTGGPVCVCVGLGAPFWEPLSPLATGNGSEPRKNGGLFGVAGLQIQPLLPLFLCTFVSSAGSLADGPPLNFL
jgi:hypothetical protein